ncbi:MAG: dihydrodipicolinate synthase family protein [Haloplanus sp.]
MTLDLSGVNPANLMPFTEDEEIDEPALRSHVRDLLAFDRVNAIVCNGHAGEAHALSVTERERVVEILAEETGSANPVISGVGGGATREVVDVAERMQAAGADGILLFPSYEPMNRRREAAVGYVEDVAAAIDVPVVVFQLSAASGKNYESSVLAELAQVEGVTAVKNAVWDVTRYQEDVRAIRDAGADVQLLVGNDEHLLASYAIAADGTVLELAAAIPRAIIDLFDAVQNEDMDRAREIHFRLQPFLDAIYQPPTTDGPMRLKEALRLRGTLDSAKPRRPAVPVPESEIEDIRTGMEASGLL